MKKALNGWTCGAAALLFMGATPAFAGFASIMDNFEMDTSANYTVVEQGGPDSSIAFAFDYIAAGYPLAPNSTAGDVGGLRMTANDTLGASNTLTAFHNTLFRGNYTLQVDVYMGVEGNSGTTEFMTVGIAGDGVTPNSIFTPIAGAGHFISVTGEGGSASDFRHFTPSVTAVPSGDPSYLTPENTTNASGSLYQSIFPEPDFEFPGSPGNAWVTLTIDVAATGVTYAFNGVPIIQTPVEEWEGFVSLGIHEAFSSVADPFQSQFIIYDNLIVTPEPASLALLALGGAALLRRRR
jgi:hypothetical protein